ncbi:MAG: type VI secretion system contractile sheath large subunit [Alphaproteobacteria bacterium]|nr:type VI secretion system contractile sheath large subunit [Alphaproteobacteria bacterium]
MGEVESAVPDLSSASRSGREAPVEEAAAGGQPLGPLSADIRALLHDLVPWLRRSAVSLPTTKQRLAGELCRAIAEIDRLVGEQVSEILHAPRLQRLEASWRGLRYLTESLHRARRVKIRMMSASWQELSRDFDRAADTEQTVLFDRLYNQEYDLLGGEPFGLLIGDYEVAHQPVAGGMDDITTIRGLADLGASVFCPVVLGAHPVLFGLDDFADLETLRDLPAAFRSPEYVRWEALRDHPSARFVGLVVPRVMFRRPYRAVERASGGLPFEEYLDHGRGDIVWGSAVYPLAAVAGREFSTSGWFASMRGARPGEEMAGLVDNLTRDDFETDSPGVATKGSTDVLITPDLEKDLFDLGVMPLVPCSRTGLAAFFECPSLHRRSAAPNAERRQTQRLNTMINYVLCVSRFGHCLKMMGRQKVGTHRTAAEVEEEIRNWLRGYTIGTDDATSEAKARDPLRDFDCRVMSVPGMPGVLSASVMVQPHYQFDELDASFELTVEFNRTTQ